ncbi:MAG: hypothetical protein ACP5VS_03255 [Desulfomonilaceae bacterium]
MCLKFCLNGASFLVLIFPVHYTVKGEANPIDSSAKATPSRVIKLGYLVMADTHKDSLDRHHPKVTPERDSGLRYGIQLCQSANPSISHV